MPNEYAPSSYAPSGTGDCEHRSEGEPDCIVSMHGGYSDKGRVGQVYPTGFITTDPKIRAMREGAKIRRGMSVEGNEERGRGSQNRI